MIYLVCNLVNFDKTRDIYHRQKLCIESLKYIKDEVNIISCGNESDISIIPSFVETVILSRNAKKQLGHEKDVPFIRDLLKVLHKKSSNKDDILGLFNSDIFFNQDSISLLKKHIACRNRTGLMVSCDQIEHCNTLEEVEKAETLKSNMGMEIFLFRADLLKGILEELPDFILGEAFWDLIFRNILRSKTKCARVTGVVKHINHQKKWWKESIGKAYNKKLRWEWLKKKEKERLMSWLDMILELMKSINEGDHILSDWEIGFIEDINNKYEQDENFEPSFKQGEKIETIYYKN